MEEKERPLFFTHCPICNAETPHGATYCPQCRVDLEIARANFLKDAALAIGKYGFAVGHEVAKTQAPKRNITFGAVIGYIFLCFVLLAAWGFLNDIFLTPALRANVPATATAIPTRKPYPTLTPRANVAPPSCILWSQITPSMAGRTLCVYGNVKDIRNSPALNSSYIYFGSREQFFLVTSDIYFPDLKIGDCVEAEGAVEFNTYKTPYIKISDLAFCY